MKKNLLCWFLLLITTLSVNAQQFVHPGLSHKKSDLERMRAMVQAKVNPYYSSFIALSKDSKASLGYNVKGNSSTTEIRENHGSYEEFKQDSRASYLQALMWVVTRDEGHAQKAVEIFNTWKNLTSVYGAGTASLNAGRAIYPMLEAAEIIKHTYSGWSSSDQQAFKNMLVYPGYSNESKPSNLSNTVGTFYWRMFQGDRYRHGNQGIFGWRGVLAIAIFTDNQTMYDRAMNYIKGEGTANPAGDIPYESGAPVIPDNPSGENPYYKKYSINTYSSGTSYWGYNDVLANYIWENGQCQESSRDQDHAILGIGLLASMGEIAWNQGEDLYGYLNNRILSGVEYSLRYNVSDKYNDFADQSSPWEPTKASGEFIQRHDRSGRFYSVAINPFKESNNDNKVSTNRTRGHFKTSKRPFYELLYSHYKVREGLDDNKVKWVSRARNICYVEEGVEKNGWSLDHLGWGHLTDSRPMACAGEPVKFINGIRVSSLHNLPEPIEAEYFDYKPFNRQGRTYSDLSNNNSGNSLRLNEDVDIESINGGYAVNDIESGEWVSYTVNVPKSLPFALKMNYAALKAGGKIEIEFLSQNDTISSGVINVPFGGNGSTGATDWKTIELKDSVQLHAGTQLMKVKFSGVSGAFKIDRFEFKAQPENAGVIQLNGKDIHGKIKLNWNIENILPKKIEIFRGTSSDRRASNSIAQVNDKLYYNDSSYNEGDDVYYWVKVTDSNNNFYYSNSYKANTYEGWIRDEFDITAHSWVPVTSGASEELENGALKVKLAVRSNDKRADVRRQDGVNLHVGKFPIVAFKLRDLPLSARLTFEVNYGAFKRGANKYTGKIGDIFYYDLTDGSFGNDNVNLPTDRLIRLSKFQLKVADIDLADGEHYYVDWVRSFGSVEEISGLINDDFKGGNKDGWETVTNGANTHVVDQELRVELAHRNDGTRRADIRRNIEQDTSAVIHAGRYPIIAIKMDIPESARVTFDTNLGSFGNGSNKYTSKINNIYYFDLTKGGFGSSNEMLSEEELTYFTKFQFKVADITSNDSYYYVDWVKSFESIEQLNIAANWIDDDFNDGTDGWFAVTNEAEEEAAFGKLNVKLATRNDGTKRGDIKRAQGATLHAGTHPIIAIKMQRPASGNIILDTNIGAYGNGKNNFSGMIGDVYYFDLQANGFGSGNTMLSTTESTRFSTFQIKVADITSGEECYSYDWIKVFKSVDDLKSRIKWLDDDFSENKDFGWNAATHGSSSLLQDGKLKVNLATKADGTKRGDIERVGGAIVHAGTHPIIAIKMQVHESARITLDTKLGAYGNESNQYTGKIDDVYYFDLTTKGFGAGNRILSKKETTELALFQFKVADIVSDDSYYTCDWVKCFSSVEELESAIGATTQKAAMVTQPSLKVDSGSVVLYPNPVKSQLNIQFSAPTQEDATFIVVDILGKVVMQQYIGKNTSHFSINLNGKWMPGVYHYSIVGNTFRKSDRFIVK
ncbi:DUF4979 domain-containing protein [Prolixibacteraceae bacterium JC049]|nr:DUF4979 domain-containing protein [Prolixibacteraceae bacterium JC049]